jgi:glutamate racemase
MIGVFDSGLGGLTVLKSLKEALPEESFIYLGDTARLPYGLKSANTIKKYLKQNIQFLLAHKVDAVVIACNSASSVFNSADSYPVPVYDVIRPSAELAAKQSMEERIGILATRTTVEQKSYVKELHKINPHISVYQQACPLLVPLVEEGWTDDPLTNLVVHRYVKPVAEVGVDTLILGCTHYPLLAEAVRKVVGQQVQVISSAESVTAKVCQDFEAGLIPRSKQGGQLQIFTTDLNSHFQHTSQRIFAPHPIDRFELICIH